MNARQSAISVVLGKRPASKWVTWKLRCIMTDTIIANEGGMEMNQTIARRVAMARAEELAPQYPLSRPMRDTARKAVPSLSFVEQLKGVL